MLLTLSAIGLAAFVAIVVVLSWYGRRSETWGATAEEVAMPMSGDEWLDDASASRLRMTRATTIEAPPEVLWPWIAQVGRGAGWYSYDRLDNGGRPSARHIVSWIPQPRVGDSAAIGYLRRVEPGRELVWWLPGIRFLGARFRGVTLYRVGTADDGCRLVVRIQAEASGLLGGFACWLFRVVDGFMARRQLVEIKAQSERYAGQATPPNYPRPELAISTSSTR